MSAFHSHETSAEIQRAIILELAAHGPLNHFDIAAAVDQAPFRVRGELRYLKRERAVRERLSPEAHTWQLTDRGWRLYSKQQQLRMV